MIGDDPRLRFRLWINGTLVDEAVLDTSEPDAEEHVDKIRARHEAIADAADQDGHRWLVEVYDPALPDDRAYLRFGTDPVGMVKPRPADPAVIARYRHLYE